MEVVFRTNLGSRDAVELGLDHTECVIGAKVNVSEETCDNLVARGLVEPVEKPAMPKTVKAVPPAASIAKSKDTTTKTDD